jgi:hypothetical protein
MTGSPATFDVFISYSHQDNEVVDFLCDDLKKHGLNYFRDAEGIRLGTEWRNELANAIDKCRYFALIHSAAADSSDFVKEELAYAGIRLRKGWIRLDDRQPNDSINLMFSRFQACIAFTGDRREKIRDFAKSIYETLEPSRSAPPPTGSLKHSECPYRGLSSYDGSQSDRLYGRHAEIGNLSESIYQSVEETNGSERNANKRLFFIYGPSGTGKTSLISAGVVPALGNHFHTVGPYRLSELSKSFVDYAKEADGESCVIALDQFEELWAESDKAIPAELFKRINEDGIHGALNRYRNLVILLSFREEYLAKMQELFQAMNSYWNRHVVRGLKKEAAEECIRGPAKERGIEYEDKLVSALVNGLAMDEDQIGEDGSRPSYVEPVELQIVCERLWRELPEGIPSIHSSHLRQVCTQMNLLEGGSGAERVDELAATFVNYATQGFLDSTVKMVSATEAAKACNYDDPDRIYFALLQFVSDSNKRVSLNIHREAGGEWVGRLPIRIVKELTDNRLLRAVNVRGELRFELIHDRLAVPISAKKERLGLLYAVNSLDSAMTKVKRERKDFRGWFEDYEPLIKDLTEFKMFEGLNSEEAEFVFRSALVYDARKQDDLEAWARTVAEQHPTVLAKVLHDAFGVGQQNGRVRINAAILLRHQWLQSKLGRDQLLTILTALDRVCRAITDDAELEELCYTLASCPHPEPGEAGCNHIDHVLSSVSEGTGISSRNLLWMRDKVDMTAGGCFVKRWKSLSAAHRAWLMFKLYVLRLRQSFVRMTFIIVISAIVTGIGAGAMYAFWGVSGSSFTQASASSGAEQGIFHGFFGGITWGFTLSLATLIYWLILRGRRIEKTFSHWFGGVALSTVAGFLGGVALAVMVLAVDTPESMQSAGWLYHIQDFSNRYVNAFQLTKAGWIFPIYGTFLGMGVGWSMLNLYHDKGFRSFVGTLGQLTNGKQLRHWTSSILARVFVKSWPVAIGMAAAGLAMVFLFQTKCLDCAPYQRNWPSRCVSPDPKRQIAEQGPAATGELPIAPLEWRALGTSVIIYFGAYSLTVGYLLALLTIRFGVEVPEDKSFLGGF